MAQLLVVTQKVVVCGGGNAAHVFCTFAASNPTNEVHLLSLFQTEAKDFETALNQTEDRKVTIDLVQDKKQVKAKPANITNDPKCLVGADVVIISLPAFAHNQYLTAIKEYVKPRKNKTTLVACFPGLSGLDCDWISIFGKENKDFVLLSAITLPWACRIKSFGQCVEILSTKAQIEVSVKVVAKPQKQDEEKNVDVQEVNKGYIRKVSEIIGPKPVFVDYGHVLNMSLSAISAIVHPSIMYSKWKDYDGKPLDEKPLFYQGLDQEAADRMTQLSNEALAITKNIEKETGLTLVAQPIFEWYKSCYGKEAGDTSTLFKLIKTNPGYNGLTHPMIQNDDGKYVPNWKYRYLSQDIPYGLVVIRGLSLILAEKNQCDAPLMDKIIKWGQGILGKEFLKYEENGSIVAGKDIAQSRAPQRYAIKSIKDLV
eukprot:72130_1